MEQTVNTRTRLVELAAQLVDTVSQATRDYQVHVSAENDLTGLPAEGVARARDRAASMGEPGYSITLDTPSYERAIAALSDRALRKALYEAYYTRASDHGPRAKRFDAGPIVEEILEQRALLATEAGYPNYAAFALRNGLFTSPDAAEQYLLASRRDTRTHAEVELNRLWVFAKEKGVPRGFSHWDLAYYSAWLQRETFGYDGSAPSARHALSNVTATLSLWCERLLGVRLMPLAPPGVAQDSELTLVLEPVGPAACAACDGVRELTLSWFAPEVAVRKFTSPTSVGGLRLIVSCGLEPPLAGEGVWLDAAALASLFGQVATAICEAFVHDVSQDPALEPPPLGARLAGNYFEQLARERRVLSECGAQFSDAAWASASQAFALNRHLRRSMALEMQLFDLRIHRDYIPRDRASRFRGQVEDTFIHVRRKFSVLPAPYWTRVANTQTPLFAAGWGAHLWEQAWIEDAGQELFHRLGGANCTDAGCGQLSHIFFSRSAEALASAVDGLVTLPGATLAAAE